VVIQRTSTFDDDEEPTLSFYTSSHPPRPGCAPYFARLARGHWGGCESRNHWVRDASKREDKTRSKNYHLNCNLSALRVCLVAIKADLHPDSSWPELQESCQYDPHVPFQTILKHRSKRKHRVCGADTGTSCQVARRGTPWGACAELPAFR
jgi:hypothetical protein